MSLDSVVKTKEQKRFLQSVKDDKSKAWAIAKLSTKLCRKCRKQSVKRNMRNMTTKIEDFCPDCQSMFLEGSKNVS